MPKPPTFTRDEHTERLITRCINYVETAWEQFKRPTVRRAISQAYSARARRFCGMTAIELGDRLMADERLHCIRHPRGGTYFMPAKAWNELGEDQRRILIERILQGRAYRNADAGTAALVSDGERSVQYFVPSPMQAFLKKG